MDDFTEYEWADINRLKQILRDYPQQLKEMFVAEIHWDCEARWREPGRRHFAIVRMEKLTMV
jgi:hypothetical protein